MVYVFYKSNMAAANNFQLHNFMPLSVGGTATVLYIVNYYRVKQFHFYLCNTLMMTRVLPTLVKSGHLGHHSTISATTHYT